MSSNSNVVSQSPDSMSSGSNAAAPVVPNAVAQMLTVGVGTPSSAASPSTQNRVFSLRSRDVVAAKVASTKCIASTSTPIRDGKKLKKSASLVDAYDNNARVAFLYHSKPNAGTKVQVNQQKINHVHAAIVDKGVNFTHRNTVKKLLYQATEQLAARKKDNLLRSCLTEVYRGQFLYVNANEDGAKALRPLDRVTFWRQVKSLRQYIDARHPGSANEIQFHSQQYIEHHLALEPRIYDRFPEFYEYDPKA